MIGKVHCDWCGAELTSNNLYDLSVGIPWPEEDDEPQRRHDYIEGCDLDCLIAWLNHLKATGEAKGRG